MREAPILYSEKEMCCGCCACASICSRHAISMVEDIEGFLYPHLDESKCVGCLACINVCPMKDS